uniref:SWIM-type domain-containing protein n=1 Tax=Chromera velia CCMP2878 TaxID=1169474 RepID=A0A0G4IAB0_9ALVE|eukprot:Cvel_12490.t1-p1 / transcript=Cvel_12490.t1 / gene=Cvel_12490 / organism=Chromera_velia_CCMP2878 / gene_product=hypothetical protein / transcript_product=hypothetical protein / location=Cvel_scaffold819:30025-32565(-) / protein_length=188 / sequence_SO=supercontig / SO=protein_coding / is_pseudo=false
MSFRSSTQLFQECLESLERGGDQDGVWCALECLDSKHHGSVFPKALDVLDRGKVRAVETEGGERRFFLVRGSKGEEYLVLPGFCGCDFFQREVLGSGCHFTCKHEAAVRIGESLGMLSQQSHEKGIISGGGTEMKWVEGELGREQGKSSGVRSVGSSSLHLKPTLEMLRDSDFIPSLLSRVRSELGRV